MPPSSLKHRRQSRPSGAYSHGRADRAAGRVDSGIVLRGQDRQGAREAHTRESTRPVEREEMREANRVAALEAARESSRPGQRVSEQPESRPDRELESLRKAMNDAIAERRYTDALSHIIGLVAANPSDPRWPHKYGDLLRMLGRNEEAAAAFRRSAARYEASGFTVRAKAMLRLADELDGKSSAEPG